jgi:hypothetical protein
MRTRSVGALTEDDEACVSSTSRLGRFYTPFGKRSSTLCTVAAKSDGVSAIKQSVLVARRRLFAAHNQG